MMIIVTLPTQFLDDFLSAFGFSASTSISSYFHHISSTYYAVNQVGLKLVSTKGTTASNLVHRIISLVVRQALVVQLQTTSEPNTWQLIHQVGIDAEFRPFWWNYPNGTKD